MTAKEFHKIALSLPETEERSHMDHPDFRVPGKLFATLGYPDKSRGLVQLSPEDQHYFSKDDPDVCVSKRHLGTARRHQCLSQKRKERNYGESNAGRLAQQRSTGEAISNPQEHEKEHEGTGRKA